MLVLDPDGAIVKRATGLPRKADVIAALGSALQPAGPVTEVTAGLGPNTIGFVMSQAAKTLTKRRAVDFCHVATAICPPPATVIPGPRRTARSLFRRPG